MATWPHLFLLCAGVLLLAPQALTVDIGPLLRRFTLCPDANPIPGHEVCYILTYTANATSPTGYTCASTVDPNYSATPLQYTTTDGPVSQLFIHSPGYYTGTDYPNDRLCFYNPPQCPGTRQISWFGPDFILEDPVDYCSDTVELIGLSTVALTNGGATLHDPIEERALCGDQGIFDLETSGGNQINVRFYSGSENRAKGFFIYFQCVVSSFA